MSKTFPDYLEKIKKKVVGQDYVIDRLGTYLLKHLLKSIMLVKEPAVNHPSSCVLLMGASGTGKTYITKTLCNEFNLSYIEINAKSITQEGWSGTSFIQALNDEIKAYPDPATHPGIVVLVDEFDKMCMPQDESKHINYHYIIQASILKYLDGMEVNIKGKSDTILMSYNTGKLFYVF